MTYADAVRDYNDPLQIILRNIEVAEPDEVFLARNLIRWQRMEALRAPISLTAVAHEEMKRKLVELLRPLQLPLEGDCDAAYGDRDAQIRSVIRAALRELGVYDAGGCPLCLS